MTGDPLRQLLRSIGRFGAAAGSTISDLQLLERFVQSRDQAAFELLLRRHGPMVLGVCQRMLADSQDAEDNFQTTFLVLVRKAADVDHAEALGEFQGAEDRAQCLRGASENAEHARRDRCAQCAV
jgi:hypothetical protein